MNMKPIGIIGGEIVRFHGNSRQRGYFAGACGTLEKRYCPPPSQRGAAKRQNFVAMPATRHVFVC
jgi:hypothetical protein